MYVILLVLHWQTEARNEPAATHAIHDHARAMLQHTHMSCMHAAPGCYLLP